MKNKKGLTLVELLAVIVILAVILVIAVPQILKTIEASRMGAIESSAKLIASNADEYYLAQQTLDPNYTGSGVTREDVSKLSNDYESCSITYNNGKATVKLKGAAVDEMLERLGIDYVDLLLLHQPAGDYITGYKMIEKAVKEGKVKSIGVSNFEGEPLEEILKICEIKPSVIQVEAHPYYPQTELKKQIENENIHIQAWFPLGHGDPTLREQEIFTELANKYNKSNVQIILRWHIQSGHIVIPGATKEEHIKS